MLQNSCEITSQEATNSQYLTDVKSSKSAVRFRKTTKSIQHYFEMLQEML